MEFMNSINFHFVRIFNEKFNRISYFQIYVIQMYSSIIIYDFQMFLDIRKVKEGGSRSVSELNSLV